MRMNTVRKDTTDYFAGEGKSFYCIASPVPHLAHRIYTSVPRPQFFTVGSEEITPNTFKGSRRQWNSFEHYKCSRKSPTVALLMPVLMRTYDLEPHRCQAKFGHWRYGVGGFSAAGGGIEPFGEPGLPISGLTGLYSKRADGGFVPPPADLDKLNTLAMKTMLPAIKSELSLINSLFELKDFKTLPRSLKSIVDTLNTLKVGTISLNLHRIGAYTKATLRQLLRGGSDAYLQQQFNILPLLSDIAGIQSALSKSEKAINDLVARSGRVQVRHFAYNYNELKDTPEEKSASYYMYPVGGPYGVPAAFLQYTAGYCTRNVSNHPSVFHAQIEYNYNYTQYQLAHAQVLGLLDSFGVNLNPAIIWNAIPWSFVIDWVISVSKWLDQFKVQNMEPKINIRRYLWSIKRERYVFTRKHFLTTLGSGAPVQHSTGVLPLTIETSYRRHVGMPSTSLIQSSGLSLREVSLGAALVLSRRRRPRPRR
jgi:hypothetical protein